MINPTQKKPFLTKNVKVVLAAVLVVALTVVSIAAAAQFLVNPKSENVIDSPRDRPTPTPTPTPTANPTPTPQTKELHLSSNLTVGQFYIGDTLKMVAVYTPAASGINISLWNNGGYVTYNLTNSNGVATFERKPVNPFNYSVSATV